MILSRYLCGLALGAACLPAVSVAQDDAGATLARLRLVDQRMATIAYRLTTSNAALCRALAPTPGWSIHSLAQYGPDYRPAARAAFGFETPFAIEALVPGAPAEKAGVAANDSLVAIDGTPVPGAMPSGAAASSAGRDATLAVIANEPADRPLSVTLEHDGQRRTVTVPRSPGCRSNFEVLLDEGMDASADGKVVQIGVRFFEKYADDEVAVVAAHELAHNILNHRARLDAAKVSRGLLAEFGRNGRLFRQTEDDADQLGLYLLYNAGYDPRTAVRFWRDHGGDVDGGLFRARTHRSASARAKRIEEEIARIPADAGRPYLPPILTTRDQPLQ